MELSLAQLTRQHQLLTGVSPIGLQLKLYEAASEGMRGLSYKGADPLLFEALAVLAYAQAANRGNGLSKVYMLVRSTLDKWAFQELEGLIRHALHMYRGHPTALRHLGDLFKSLHVGHQASPEQPDLWVSFGFTREDPLPSWMKESLAPNIFFESLGRRHNGRE